MIVLESKQFKDFDYFSRYQNVPYYFHKIDRKYIVGTSVAIDKNTPYILYKVKQGDTLDSIALNYYNNPTFYWIIADANNIQNPFIKLKVDSQIKIPLFNEVKFNLGK